MHLGGGVIALDQVVSGWITPTPTDTAVLAGRDQIVGVQRTAIEVRRLQSLLSLSPTRVMSFAHLVV